ncbi:MAG: hypothetical protein L0332_29450 [Chloroflexi bacterium]|nr:hypothetical protein [Chloroflexota bacterium]MCI0579548.1 hypothetical protein [Chloroflexota bacterium]MCI0647517.1 hypothetical protein [Chloroflexota bacterium]MCI0730828.1 hypothetical protein [Chloroflexota bacterium]
MKRITRLHLYILLALFGVAVAGCSGRAPENTPEAATATPVAQPTEEAGEGNPVVSGPVMGMPAENFASLEEMVASADAIVLATVREAGPGRTVGEGDAALSFTDYTLEVSQVLKGPADLQTLKIEAVGGITSAGPGYQIGATYLLFLRERTDLPEGYYREVSPQGLFQVGDDGLLVASVEDPVTQALAGKTLDEAITVLDLES